MDDTNRAGHRLPRLQPWTQSEPDPALRSEAFPLLPMEDFFPQMVLTAKALGAGFTGETAPVPQLEKLTRKIQSRQKRKEKKKVY